MKLLIAIPALNEEDSIRSIIERSLAARDFIKKNSFVTVIDITVVSDGSTDRTVEIASRFEPQIKLIVFKKNRGYGAAIKEAWRQSDADLLGFLDADGTCDPNFFAELCRGMETRNADIGLGCRMNPKSKMPIVRKIGNTLYAALLSIFSSSAVRDTASGMRVIRRSCLKKLMPLPDGLHFTPAMSARAILSKDLKIIEIDMPYEERAGESKLHIWKDGVRFLRVIMESAILYRPERILGLIGFLALAASCLLMVIPTTFYIHHARLEEWMIYRFVVSSLGGITACLFLCAAYLCSKIVTITISKYPWSERNLFFLGHFFSSKAFWLVPVGLMLAGSILIYPSLIFYMHTGTLYEHWSRFIAMSFLFSAALILIVTKLIDFTLELIAARVSYLNSGQHSKEWPEMKEVSS